MMDVHVSCVSGEYGLVFKSSISYVTYLLKSLTVDTRHQTSPVELTPILSPDSPSAVFYISWWVPGGLCGTPQ